MFIFWFWRLRLRVLHRNPLDLTHQFWLRLIEKLVIPDAPSTCAGFETSEAPDTQLAVEGAEVCLLAKELGSDGFHENIGVVNCEGAATRYPKDSEKTHNNGYIVSALSKNMPLVVMK